VSLIADAGSGAWHQVPLGKETGNVVFDRTRNVFWITVVGSNPPDQLVEIDPDAKSVIRRIPLPGCEGAHGLRLHPDAKSAFIACEDNNSLARVDLDQDARLTLADTGKGPDVLAVDPDAGLLYVAAESGDLTVFDLHQSGLAVVDRENVGNHAHTVAVDPATHRVFFPLQAGPTTKPVLRIMRTRGTWRSE
jgi:DNA-binding beta-propeller fold protein YncE